MVITLRLTLTFWLIIRDAYLKHCKQKKNNKIWPTSSPCLFKRCFKLIMTFNQRYMKETLSRDRFMKINSYHRKPIPSLLIFISIHFCRHQIVWAILITDHMETKTIFLLLLKKSESSEFCVSHHRTFFDFMQTFRLYFAKSRSLAQTIGLWLDLVWFYNPIKIWNPTYTILIR